MFVTTKLATAAVTGVLSLAVTGAAAFAAFQPPAATTETATIAETATASAPAERGDRGDKDRGDKGEHLKAILDRLVQNGTITQAQEDAILKAFKEAAGHRKGHDVAKHLLKDLMRLSTDYLGIDKERLAQQLKAGKSLGEIANATPGKSREGLIAYDVAQVSAQLDKAVAEGTITKDQADEVKKGLVEHVTKFVDHKFERKPTAAKRDGKNERGDRQNGQRGKNEGRDAKPAATPKPTT